MIPNKSTNMWGFTRKVPANKIILDLPEFLPYESKQSMIGLLIKRGYTKCYERIGGHNKTYLIAEKDLKIQA